MDLIAGYSLPNGLLNMNYNTRNRAGQPVQPSTDTITNAITQGLLPMLASAGIGTGAGIAGQFGEAENLGRLAINKLGGNVNPNTTLPTQEGILSYLNSITPLKPYTDNTYTKIGANLLAPILDPTALITTARASKPVAKAVGEHAWNKTEDMMRQQGLMPNIVPNEANKTLSAFVPNVKAGEEMIVRHNLTPEKLYAADKLGAMPVPSLGITKTGFTDPLQDFGDITLIGGKEMAIPSKTNPVYSADAFTIRKPYIFTKTDIKADEFLSKKLAEPYGHLADDSNVKSDISNTLRNLDSNLENSSLLKMKYLENQGMLPNSKDFKSASEFRRAARDKFDELPENELTKFYDWQPEYISKLREEAIQAGGTIKDQLFKGRSNVTGRELYEPATVENIVKRMSKAKPGDEGNFYTAGSLRGKLVPTLKNEKDIQKNRNKIISADDFEAFKEKINNKHSEINSDLNKFLEDNKSGVDANAFLEELALGTTHKYEYSRDLAKKVPQELKDRISAYAKELKEAPTSYFEIKPKRAVGIGEFKGAIVPSDVSPKTMSILEKNGIRDVYKYSSPDERKQLVKKFGKEFFAGIPLVSTAMYDNQKGNQ